MKNIISYIAIFIIASFVTYLLTPVVLTENASGKRAEIYRYQPLILKLPSNPTTGYSWNISVEPSPKTLKFISSKYISPKANLVGAPGQEIWSFRAGGPGKTMFKLSYARSFAKDEKPAREFLLAVTVK